MEGAYGSSMRGRAAKKLEKKIFQHTKDLEF